jgi:DDE superfamily endonuclease
MLLANYRSLLGQGWQSVFSQPRSHQRALEHALAWPSVLGERTIASTVTALGRDQQDWSADYKIYSRSPWSSQALFEPVVDDYLERYPHGPILGVLDDTGLARNGKKIPGASWQRDPLSPPFHVNLRWGQRFIQMGLLFPLYREREPDARSLPIRFEEAPVVRRPGKRASEEEQQAYREQKKKHNLSTQAVALLAQQRQQWDEKGASRRRLIVSLDGSYCNRIMFRAELDRITLLARCRKDARLCFPAPASQRRQYGEKIFTPQQVRQDGHYPYKRARLRYAGQRRWVRYKVVSGVLWQRGSGTRPRRLIVVAPQPYKLSHQARTYYREPAYLLTTDLKSPVQRLLQAYFDRWQIEINHREEKHWLGLGQAQVWSKQSVPRHPAFVVACYSLLWLASLRAYGPTRSQAYLPLPKWRRSSQRPSLRDLLALLRKQINETCGPNGLPANFSKKLIRHAHT